MRKSFPWYFRPNDDEYQTIWKTAILSIDANVLLDLYRYHHSTRDALLKRLREFSGRVWLTRQAAEEFVKNRHKVIAEAQKTFEDAREAVKGIVAAATKAAQTLKSSRLLPPDLPDRVSNTISDEVKKFEDEIASLKKEHPDYLKEDMILDTLADLFQDRSRRTP